MNKVELSELLWKLYKSDMIPAWDIQDEYEDGTIYIKFECEVDNENN